MLRDSSFEGSGEWGTAHGDGGGTSAPSRERVQCADDSRCEQIHLRLRHIATARGALDLQEAEALREADAACIWRRYGYSSLIEYMEHELGYTPRAAVERIRVAKAIVELPLIGEAMSRGELSYSAARELTRVATAQTEGEWLAAARELDLRQLEDRVAGHKRGDRPSDRPDPQLRRRPQTFEMTPETEALYRQALQILDKERGERHDRNAFMAAVCRLVIDGGSGGDGAEADGGCRSKAPYQIAITQCRDCKRAWQDGGGLTVEVSPPTLSMAMCDAELIGPVDGEVPQRASRTIPPAVKRLVWRRDHGRCRVPGCRSSHNLDVHHLEFLMNGGSHEPKNLVVLCEGHHRALHEGSLVITGGAPALVFTRRASDAFTAATRVVDTAAALEKLGYKRSEAKAAAEQTRTHVGTGDWPIEDWIKYALSRCGRPR